VPFRLNHFLPFWKEKRIKLSINKNEEDDLVDQLSVPGDLQSHAIKN